MAIVVKLKFIFFIALVILFSEIVVTCFLLANGYKKAHPIITGIYQFVFIFYLFVFNLKVVDIFSVYLSFSISFKCFKSAIEGFVGLQYVTGSFACQYLLFLFVIICCCFLKCISKQLNPLLC